MLVMMLRTVTLVAPRSWCSRRTSSSDVVPASSRRRSSQPTAGIASGSCSRSRCTSWTTKLSDSAIRSTDASAAGSGGWSLVPSRRSASEVGVHPLGPAVQDQAGRAPQVLDQHDAQRDGDRPQFADGERLDRLVGAHEARQHLGVEAAVAMGDERPRDPEHARVAGERPLAQLRQLAIVGLGQVGADFADLLLDEMEIVQEPFRGGRPRLAFDRGRGDLAIGRQQHAFVVAQAGDQRLAGGLAAVDRLVGRQAVGVLLEAFDAEQLAADGIVVVTDGVRPGVPGKARGERAEQAQHSGAGARPAPRGIGRPAAAALGTHCHIDPLSGG